jgi:hypothetical protein
MIVLLAKVESPNLATLVFVAVLVSSLVTRHSSLLSEAGIA